LRDEAEPILPSRSALEAIGGDDPLAASVTQRVDARHTESGPGRVTAQITQTSSAIMSSDQNG
jgi:hypothetical protein